MKVGSFRLPISAGGETPDPATICPAAGYIENPLTEAKGWYKIAEFQTNSPSTTTFDPTIAKNSGEFAWDLGDGYLLMDAIALSHSYADGTTKPVKLYAKGSAAITSIDISADNIISVVDLSNDVFKALTDIKINSNSGVTNLILPSETGVMTVINAQGCGLEETLDLSAISTYSSAAAIYLQNNPNLPAVQFSASQISGSIKYLNVSFCKLGYVDLSKLSIAIASAQWSLQSNGWSAAIVNMILHDINTISTSGYTGRSITISGSNAAPDRSSGGYDGIAEKAEIVAKGITVNAVLVVATLTTTAMTNIAQTTAASGGEVTLEGGAYVTARGVCWSTSSPPTVSNSKTIDGDGPGTFTSLLTGLIANTTYYVRAYATNSAGTGYGTTRSFKTLT